MYFYRETLLGQLSAYIKSLQDDFTTHYTGSAAHSSQPHQQQRSDETPPTGKNLPEVVNNIVWARQLEAKVWGQTSLDTCTRKIVRFMILDRGGGGPWNF